MKNNRLYLESLGCPKNRVDSEVMLAALIADGWEVVDDPARADLILLNTCAFVEDARRETIERFFDLHRRRRKGARLAVAGCLPQRFPAISKALVEADIVLGLNDIPRIAELVGEKRGVPRRIAAPDFLMTARQGRVATLSPHTAYLKIADGCDNRCAYCAIPLIRGVYRERSPRDILEEARRLIDGGVREIVLIAQDTTAYGRDHDTDLATLLRTLNRLPGEFLIRSLYLYPSGIDGRLLDAFGGEKVIPYFEIPLQHVADRVLAAMGRRYRRADIERVTDSVLARFGERATLRTTLIAGFPGETAREFDEMTRFTADAPFDYVGVFGYSKEQGTPAGRLRSLPRRVIEERTALLRKAAETAMERRIDRFVGMETTVLYEGFDADSCLATGRSLQQAPEIDGVTILTNIDRERPGDLLPVRIVARDGVDLIAEVGQNSQT
ncbi:MAG TPA: 30S ribosomal protein S12 methylthiotransferase RimO [bacterium]|nr:30S ribosomal protein S12 methylthiotransferase RimO [bacterium]